MAPSARSGARRVALDALVSLHKGRGQRVRAELEGRGLEPRDLAFAYELAHGVLRRERLLDHVLAAVAHRGLPKSASLLAVLRLGAYQLVFLPGMPAHAAVHETVALLRANRGFANAVLRRIAAMVRDRAADDGRPRDELSLAEGRALELPASLPADEAERLAVVHSLPAWLARRFVEQHGVDGLRQIAAAASATPGVYLRAVAPADRLVEALAAAGVQVAPTDDPRLLRWTGGASPFAAESFRDGGFVAQDPTAYAAAAAAPCGPGDVVIDLCAAPGTKTTLLAEKVGDSGRVFAFDPDERRRQRVAENVARLRLDDVVEVVDAAAALAPADCVLADVPCSNTGVLGRRVEVRKRLGPSAFAALTELQRTLLRQAIALTRPGGHVVYSTCSIDREENQDVVASVCGADSGLELVTSALTLPAAGAHDGGFHAVLRRAAPIG